VDNILDHQDLLERFYKSERGIIHEFSSRIAEDRIELIEILTKYATEQKLSSTFLDRDREVV